MASSITPSVQSLSYDNSVFVLKLACVADTDGTFASKALTHSDIFGTTNPKLPAEYHKMGYRIANILAVNPAATYPTSAATVTITDATGAQIIGSSTGDTLSLSTSSSGTAVLATTRDITKRNVTDELTIAIGDTGSAANTVTIYIILERY